MFFHKPESQSNSQGKTVKIIQVQICLSTVSGHFSVEVATVIDFEAKCHKQCESEVLCLYLVTICYFVMAWQSTWKTPRPRASGPETGGPMDFKQKCGYATVVCGMSESQNPWNPGSTQI